MKSLLHTGVLMRIFSYLVLSASFLFSASIFAEGFSSLTTLKHSQQLNLGLAPVYGTLLPDGRVMFFGTTGLDGSPVADGGGFEAALSIPPNMAPFPDTVLLDLENAPLECSTPGVCVFGDESGNTVSVSDILFCSGHTLLDDGKLFTLSGSRFSILQLATGQTITELSGINYSMTYDSTNALWSRVPGILLSEGPGPK